MLVSASSVDLREAILSATARIEWNVSIKRELEDFVLLEEYPVAVAGTTGQMVVSLHLYHPNPLHRDHDIKSATIVVNRAAAFDYAG